MPEKKTLRVVVASPAEVKPERDVLSDVFEELNRGLAGERGFELKLSRWETDTYPGFHPLGPQGMIDPILNIAECDLLIGIFWKRFGTPIENGKTGTEHEFTTAYEAWKEKGSPQVFVYFNQKAHTPNSKPEIEQWGKVIDFRDNFPKEGLWWPYKGKPQFEKLVRNHLANYLKTLPKPGEKKRAARQPRKPKPQPTSDNTERDKYLDYIIHCNTYLDPRGVMQTQRSVSLPLEEVFVTLKGEHEAQQQLLDRRRLRGDEDGFESELDDPYAQAARANMLPTAKIELTKTVSEQTRIVLLGDPGAGKTTLMRFLTLQFAKACRAVTPTVCDKRGNDYGETRLPIFLRIADYAEAFAKDRNLHLRDFLARSFTNLDLPAKTLAALFNASLREGKALVLLDGLDEIVDRSDRSAIAREIETFTAALDRRNRVIVTSRIAGYREAPLDGSFALYTLRELDLEQIEKFLNRWCVAVETKHTPDAPESEIARRAKVEIDSILDSVKSNAGVKRLASNPLMLTILALIHRNGSRLPNRRVELYELAVKTLLEDWQLARGTPTGAIIQEAEAMQILAPLAFWLHSEKPRGVANEGEIKDQLTKLLAKRRGVPKTHPDLPQAVNDFLRRVRESTGLLVERAPRQYGFMHLTFEEYFAAREVLRQRKQRAQLIYQYRHQPRWEEVTLLAIGHLSKDYPDDAADLIRTAILAEGEEAKGANHQPSLYEDVLHRDLLFAARCLGDCAALETDFRQATVKCLIELYFSEIAGRKYQQLRELIRERISYLKSSDAEADAVELLRQALTKDKADEVRGEAALALGAIGSEVAVADLRQALTKDKGDDVRGRAVEALEEIRGEAVVADLRQALTKDKAERVRWNAALALGRIGGEAAVADLWQALTKDKIDNVQWGAAFALGAIGGEAAVAALRQVLIKNKANGVRGHAAFALGEMGGEAAVVMLQWVLTKDKAESVRGSAAYALAEIGGEAAVGALRQALTKDKADEVRGSAAEALGAIGSEAAVADLRQALTQDKADEVRGRAAEALGAIGGEAAVADLRQALTKDKAERVRGGAAFALGEIRGEAAVADLRQALTKDKAERVRVGAALALGAIGSEAAVADLWWALTKDKADRVRENALYALGKIGGGAAVAALRQVLTKDKTDVGRGRAAEALGAIGGEAAVAALRRALTQDKANWVRERAASALGQIGGEQDVALLLQYLIADDNTTMAPYVAHALVTLLGQRKHNIKQSTIRAMTERMRGLLNQAGFEDQIVVLVDKEQPRHYLHQYDVIWEALWNVCQKQGIV